MEKRSIRYKLSKIYKNSSQYCCKHFLSLFTHIDTFHLSPLHPVYVCKNLVLFTGTWSIYRLFDQVDLTRYESTVMENSGS